MAKVIREELALDNVPVFFWSDSMIAIHWIRQVNRKWKVFVSNRISQIRKLSSFKDWRYCSSGDNVADIATRGISMEKLLKCEEWWSGPRWLRQTHDMDWPMEPMTDDRDDIFRNVEVEMVKGTKKVMIGASAPKRVYLLTDSVNMFRFSKLTRLYRAVAYCYRFWDCLKSRTRNSEKLNTFEVERAEKGCIGLVQAEFFANEIKELKKLKSKNENSHIEYKNVRVILVDGILYTKNRSMYNPDVKDKLILLPCHHHFVDLLIRYTHKKLMHAGVRDVMAHLRESFWIVRMRQTVKRVIDPCVICRGWSAKHFDVKVAPLPPERVTPTRAFDFVGLDFAGPILLFENDIEHKAYILLFTCATTRAVHLELCSNMSAYCFLMAFNRFIGRRRLPRVLMSDNFSTFKKINSDLIQAWKHLETTEFHDFVTSNKIEWKFIVQVAPAWGGMWERIVRSIKTPLRKVLHRTKVNTEEMRTVLTQVEMILNNRPITYMYNTPDEFTALTPNHFLGGSRTDCLPPIYDHLEGKNDLVDRYNYLESIKDKFWEFWTREYLPELNHFYQSRKTNVKEIRVGDIVLVGNDAKRSTWKLGRIESLREGKDDKARAAVVKTQCKKLITRPIQKLYPLEVMETSSSATPMSEVEADESADQVFEPARATGSNVRIESVSHDDEPITSGGTGDVGGKTRRGRATRLPTWLKKDYVLN